MQPGESLPSERRLAEVLGVSRPAVREALKRLTAAGPGRGASGRRHHRARLPPARRPRPAPPPAHPRRRARPVRRAQHPGDPAAQRTQGRRTRRPARATRTWPRSSMTRCETLAAEERPRRAAAPRTDVLGPHRRRRGLDRVPADVQHAARHLRTRAARARRCDGRRGRPPAGLPRTRRRDHARVIPTAPEQAARDLLEPATTGTAGRDRPPGGAVDDHRDRAHRTQGIHAGRRGAGSSGNTPPRG